jgi:hypothetical protein
MLIAFNINSEENMPRKTNSPRSRDTKRKLGSLEIVDAILDNPQDIEKVRSLTTKGVAYVSLNYSNPDLKKIMPWCGTSYGPESIVKTFSDAGRFWKVKLFKKEIMLTDGETTELGVLLNTMET